jgi:hypothetical protein
MANRNRKAKAAAGKYKKLREEVGSKLDRSEVRDLRSRGLSDEEIRTKIANKVDTVGSGAEKALSRSGRSERPNVGREVSRVAGRPTASSSTNESVRSTLNQIRTAASPVQSSWTPASSSWPPSPAPGTRGATTSLPGFSSATNPFAGMGRILG